MDDSLPVLETTPIQFTEEGETHCEWSTETVEELITPERKWKEVTSFDIKKPDHITYASNMIKLYNNQSDAHQIILARSSADMHSEEKDIVHLLSKKLTPS